MRALSDYDYVLPDELIATRPLNPRDGSRMLVVKDGVFDDAILNLPNYLKAGDLLVFNNTKVIPAELNGVTDTGKKVRINLNRIGSNNLWEAFGKPGKNLPTGSKIIFSDTLQAVVLEKRDITLKLRFNLAGNEFTKALSAVGKMPIPPYIQKLREGDAGDNTSYQTVFACTEGAVAAPTAGLHFTERLFKAIEKSGANKCFVTLHVGAGTFLSVKTDDITQHKMHSEWFAISEESASIINATKASGGRVIAIGTTALRAIESCADQSGIIKAGSGDTDIFIYPGYKFKVVDGLLTNFHLPKSTLLMLVSALAGYDNIMAAYHHAIRNNYRFFSYGDCCLLLR